MRSATLRSGWSTMPARAAFDGLAIDYEIVCRRGTSQTWSDVSSVGRCAQKPASAAVRSEGSAVTRCRTRRTRCWRVAVLSVLTLVGVAAACAAAQHPRKRSLPDAVRRIEERDPTSLRLFVAQKRDRRHQSRARDGRYARPVFMTRRRRKYKGAGRSASDRSRWRN